MKPGKVGGRRRLRRAGLLALNGSPRDASRRLQKVDALPGDWTSETLRTGSRIRAMGTVSSRRSNGQTSSLTSIGGRWENISKAEIAFL